MKINVRVKTNKIGSDCELELEIDDDDLKICLMKIERII